MVRIQLIEPQKGWLDVAEGTRFPINISASDIRDVGSRSGTYSKTIVLAGTENNNTLLNYYFEVNIQAGTFDINKIQKCVVWQDDEVILDNAVIRLLSVSEILGNIQYEAQVLDEASDLFVQINDKFLTDIDLTDLDHTYSSANVVASFNNTSASKYAYLLPFSNINEYPLQQCKPAVFVRTYLDRMFAAVGKQYQVSEAEIVGFSDLIVPYNGSEIKISDEQLAELEVLATKSSVTATRTRATDGAAVTGVLTNITSLTETKDLSDLFNPTTGVYTSPVNTLPLKGSVDYQITGTLKMKFINTNGHTVYLVNSLYNINTSTPKNNQYRVNLKIGCNLNFRKDSGDVIFPIDETVVISPSGTDINTFYAIPNGTTTVKTVDLNFIAPLKGVVTNETILTQLRLLTSSSFSYGFWSEVEQDYVPISIQVEIENLSYRIIPTPFLLPSGFTMEMNNVIPRNVKQSDFLKSILRMFNAYLIKIDDATYRIKPRDAYYDDGELKDWTFKLDLDKERTITFIPELTSKEILFNYKPDSKDVVASGYTNATNTDYGQQKFIFSNQYARGKDTQELIFSPTPHGLTSFGAYLPYINGFAPNNNVRILLHNRQKTCNTYSIYDYGTTGQTVSVYPQIIHLNNPTSPTNDLNFGICDFYFYPLNYFTPNNLFNKFYLRQMNQINTGKLMSAYFNLSPSDIRNIKLNDKIKVGNTVWNINKIIDYDANSNSVTKVELISTDDGKRANPPLGGDVLPTGASGPTVTGNDRTRRSTIVSRFEQQSIEHTNIIVGDGNDIKGRGNYVVGNNIILIGDNNTILADNVLGVTNNSEVLISNSIIQDATVIPAGALMDELGNLLTDENGNILTT